MMTAHELDTILDDAQDDFRGVMHRLHRHILEAAAAALDDAWEEEKEKEEAKAEAEARKRRIRHTDPTDPAQAQLSLFAECRARHADDGPPPSLSLAELLSGPPPGDDVGGGGRSGGMGTGIGIDSSPAGSNFGPGSGSPASLPVTVAEPGPGPAFAPARLTDFLPAAPPPKPVRASANTRARTSARSSKGAKVMITAKITLDLSQSPPAWRIEASVGSRRRALGRVRH